MLETRIPIAFIEPPEGAIGGPPGSRRWFEEVRSRVLERLKSMYPGVVFPVYTIGSPADVRRFLEREPGAPGYAVFLLNCISGLARPILESGKPVVLISEAYGGSGDYVLEYPRALSMGYRVVGVSARDISCRDVLSRIGLLIVIDRLRRSRVLFILSPAGRRFASLEYPLSIDLYSAFKSLQSVFGITPILLDVREFKSRYYDGVSEDEARRVAEEWVSAAESVEDTGFSEILGSARLYIAMRRAARDYEASALAIDCIVLRQEGFLDSWPCLGFTRLWSDGVVPVCEADPYAAPLLLAGKYLAGVNGFITDPAVDELRGEMIYYHCYAPLDPRGRGERLPYRIVSAHLGAKKASVSVDLPVNETITVVGLNPVDRVLTIHTARVVGLERTGYACSNKIVAKADASSIARRWVWRTGWHRVVFYGDYRREFIELARLLGLGVVEEDKPMPY